MDQQETSAGGSLEAMLSGVLNNPEAMAGIMKLAGEIKGGKSVPGDGIAMTGNLFSDAAEVSAPAAAHPLTGTHHGMPHDGGAATDVPNAPPGSPCAHQSDNASQQPALPQFPAPRADTFGGADAPHTGSEHSEDHAMQRLFDPAASADREKLLRALRPYLGEDRRSMIDTVLKLTKLMQLTDIRSMLK